MKRAGWSLWVMSLLLIGSLGLAWLGAMPWGWSILIGIAYALFLFWGSSTLSSGVFLPVHCRGSKDKKEIALTFDDGPHAEWTPVILDMLKAENIPAVFFCIGKNIESQPSILQRIINEGHVTGNHTYSHASTFDLRATGSMLADMKKGDQAITKVIGKTPLLFRPPYGVMTPFLASAIKKGNYTPIGWSIRSFDTMAKSREGFLNKILPKLHPGGVILLHDRCETTATFLPLLIHEIRRQGYTFARADKMLQAEPYA